MRVEKAIKNVLVSVLSFVFLFGVGLFARRLLLESFDTELVAYDGLLSDIFSFVSLVDLGGGALFTYRLYEAFAKDNKSRINKLVSMYRTMFIVLGSAILLISAVLFVFLPIIFAEKVKYWNYFYIMYVLYAISSVITYYFGYWRSALCANQMEYKAVRIETLISFISMILKIVILLFTKNYLLYLFASTICNVISSLIVHHISKKEFPYVTLCKTSIKDFKEEGMLKECGDLVGIKFADTITWCSSNLFTSLLINVETAAYYSNYSLIASTIWNLMTRIIKPLTASIGDVIYRETKEVSYAYFKQMSLIFFFVASIVYSGFFSVFQQAISFVFGDKYLLSTAFIFVYSIQFYITTRSDAIGCYRNCFGKYNIEKYYSLVGVVLNIIVAIVTSKYYGIQGIVLGAIVSIICTWICRMKIVYSDYYNVKMFNAIVKELLLFVLATLEALISYYICKHFSANIIGIVLSCFVSVVIPLLINICIFHRNESFLDVVKLIKSIIQKGVMKNV